MPLSVIEASFIPSRYGRAAHTGGKPITLKNLYTIYVTRYRIVELILGRTPESLSK